MWLWIRGTDRNIDVGLRGASAGLFGSCGADLDLRGGSGLAGRICGADLALESGSAELIKILI